MCATVYSQAVSMQHKMSATNYFLTKILDFQSNLQTLLIFEKKTTNKKRYHFFLNLDSLVLVK
jgi:hypothetical protein